jgi:hypothetical protein
LGPAITTQGSRHCAVDQQSWRLLDGGNGAWRTLPLIVDGGVYALDAAGRPLWEACRSDCTVDEVVAACARYGDLVAAEAHARTTDTLDS